MRRSWLFWLGTTIAVAGLATLASYLVRHSRQQS
jgi:hypothetical protein